MSKPVTITLNGRAVEAVAGEMLIAPEYETVIRVPFRILFAAVIRIPVGLCRTFRPKSSGVLPSCSMSRISPSSSSIAKWI